MYVGNERPCLCTAQKQSCTLQGQVQRVNREARPTLGVVVGGDYGNDVIIQILHGVDMSCLRNVCVMFVQCCCGGTKHYTR